MKDYLNKEIEIMKRNKSELEMKETMNQTKNSLENIADRLYCLENRTQALKTG